MTNNTCPYCNKPAVWVENKEIYGRNYGKSYMTWLCRDCDAYVGCHNNTKKPLGRMANKELREARKEAKSLFIEKYLGGTWNVPPKVKRQAYEILNAKMGKNFHFGDSTLEE